MIDASVLLEKAQALIAKIGEIKHWKGNFAPKKEHFPPESIQAEAGIDPAAQKFWIAFAFEDGGVQHTVKSFMQIDQPGTPGGNDVIQYDGEEVTADDFVLGHREGVEGFNFYARMVCEFRFTLNGEKYDIRFDGDL